MQENNSKEDRSVFNLLSQLRQERLFVNAGKSEILKLNESINTKCQELSKSAFLASKLRFGLQDHFELDYALYHNIQSITKAVFIDAQQAFGVQNALKIQQFLDALRSKPKRLSLQLSRLEHDLEIRKVLECVVIGLYSSCIFENDVKGILHLLLEMAQLQLANCNNPRRTLEEPTCSFRMLYCMLHETLGSTKTFLSGTLEAPILRILSYKDFYLDLDPDETSMRYQQEPSIKAIFSELDEYRREIALKLADFVNSVIQSLQDNVWNFPKPLAWIIARSSNFVRTNTNEDQASELITELIFHYFICPAIEDPSHGSPALAGLEISAMGAHNLRQISKILRILSLHTPEPDSVRFMADLHKLVDKVALEQFVDHVIIHQHQPAGADQFTLSGPVDVVMQNSPLIGSSPSMLIVQTDLTCLLAALHATDEERENGEVEETALEIVEQNAKILPHSSTNGRSSNGILSLIKPRSVSTTDALPPPINVLVFENAAFANTNHDFQILGEDKFVKLDQQRQSMTIPLHRDNTDGVDKRVVYNGFHNGHVDDNISDNLEAVSEAASNHSVASSLELEAEDHLLHDNLSDMVSANVSGRGSPNISGRDTPSSQANETGGGAGSVESANIRSANGDDQDNAVESGEDGSGVGTIPPPRNSVKEPVSRPSVRSDIEDKFGKFEIKNVIELDETVSIISETWSTDVLASDNEGGGSSEPPPPPTPTQITSRPLLDLSETHSESAWSTDVITSDTDRLTEVDMEDASSVAQSDETRSEIDDGGALLVGASASAACVHNDLVAPNVILDPRLNSSGLHERQLPVVASADPSARTLPTALPPTIRHANQLGVDASVPAPGSSSMLILSDAAPGRRPREMIVSNCSLSSNSSHASSSSTSSHSFDALTSKPCVPQKLATNSGPQPGSSNNSQQLHNGTDFDGGDEEDEDETDGAPKQPGSSLKVGRVSSGMASSSTGAIPKSISFDKSADKGSKYGLKRHESGSNGFFGKLRMGFRNRRGQKNYTNYNMMDHNGHVSSGQFRLDEHDDDRHEMDGHAQRHHHRHHHHHNHLTTFNNNTETSEDILAKYRTKPFVEDTMKENNENVKGLSRMRISDDNCGNVDVNNSFVDIKRKIRSVLSETISQIPAFILDDHLSVKCKLEIILRLELGQARSLKLHSNVARVSEAIRCINLLNESTCLALLQSMKEDIVQRSVYTQYLVCSKQELLFLNAYLEGISKHLSCSMEAYEHQVCSMSVRRFLAEHEVQVEAFCTDFQNLRLADEKCVLLNNFHAELCRLMEHSDSWRPVWRAYETKQTLDQIQNCIERNLMSRIYTFALYPNGDGDRDRDQVLRQHIETLSKVIGPEHRDLMINKLFLREFPWLPAQEALRPMGAYHSAKDKVQTVVNCAKCIMDLLAMSQNGGSSTTADDFTPVLVYVIIRVNPNDLLSTIQFVNSFYQQKLCGEDHYWWTQFCAAVEFIKTMDYPD